MISSEDLAVITKLDGFAPEQRAAQLKEKPLVVSASSFVSSYSHYFTIILLTLIVAVFWLLLVLFVHEKVSYYHVYCVFYGVGLITVQIGSNSYH